MGSLTAQLSNGAMGLGEFCCGGYMAWYPEPLSLCVCKSRMGASALPQKKMIPISALGCMGSHSQTAGGLLSLGLCVLLLCTAWLSGLPNPSVVYGSRDKSLCSRASLCPALPWTAHVRAREGCASLPVPAVNRTTEPGHVSAHVHTPNVEVRAISGTQSRLWHSLLAVC